VSGFGKPSFPFLKYTYESRSFCSLYLFASLGLGDYFHYSVYIFTSSIENVTNSTAYFSMEENIENKYYFALPFFSLANSV
jgi:hypothetical protein